MFKYFLKILKQKIKLIVYQGNRFFCPVCNRGYRVFLPCGVIPRPNAVCPVCSSLERHRLLWLALNKHGYLHGEVLLHVAPEPSLEKLLKERYNRYVSVDLDGSRAMMAMDITVLNFGDETFDAIVCNHVLEHIPEDRKAISELYRVLKHCGWASIQVPMKGDVTQEDLSIQDPGERTLRYGQADHVRMYGQDFKQILEEAGFEVIIIKNDEIGEPDFLERLSLNNETEVWISVKKRA